MQSVSLSVTSPDGKSPLAKLGKKVRINCWISFFFKPWKTKINAVKKFAITSLDESLQTKKFFKNIQSRVITVSDC